MSKKKNAKPTTIYRLTGVDSLPKVIKSKYQSNIYCKQQKCNTHDRESLLFTGSIVTDQVKWGTRVTDLINSNVTLENRTSGCVLLIPAQEEKSVWALCWGIGWLFLEPSYIDSAFGQKIAIRLVDPTKLASLTRKTLDERSKIDRMSIPAGENLYGFGIEGFGELVTRLAARANLSSFTVNGECSLKGSDSLSMPLGLTPSDLINDLDQLEAILQQKAQPELEVLEQLQSVKSTTETFKQLEKALNEALLSPQKSVLAISWPIQVAESHAIQETYRVKGIRDTRVKHGQPTLNDLLEWIGRDKPLERLSRVKIQLFQDAEGEIPMSQEIPLRKWIVCELTIDKEKFFLHDGSWYKMDKDYAAKLDQKVEDIFAEKISFELPDWRKGENEEAYNKRASKLIGGQLFDRKLVALGGHKRNFEACDILANSGALIHIKKARDSAALSHLFMQGANSVNILNNDEEAYNHFKRMVECDKLPDEWRPKEVIFGIYRDRGKISPNNLFSFSKVTLYRVWAELKSKGFGVYIAPIEPTME